MDHCVFSRFKLTGNKTLITTLKGHKVTWVWIEQEIEWIKNEANQTSGYELHCN